ncbi:MAG TPA: DUF72 domain-containing protein, partial [Acidobacteriota bacterium]|nr:DUF72 domain-containing protein [Acidobacteriota bacterium]
MIYFGPAGWVYRDWEGVFYPKKKERRFDPLAYTAQYFDVVEINSSFYHPPSSDTVIRWIKRVALNPRFKFTAKLWRKFTHEKDYIDSDLDQFRKAVDPLMEETKLGALLMQFPWSFKNGDEERAYLAKLVRSLSPYPLVLEVRHNSWNAEPIFEFLREMKVGFCNIDQPVIGQSIRPMAVVTAPTAYFRLHGRNYRNWFREKSDVNERYDYLYNSEELEQAKEIVETIAERSRETYAILNNHRNAQAATNALELKSRVTGRKVAAPEVLLERYPDLKE